MGLLLPLHRPSVLSSSWSEVEGGRASEYESERRQRRRKKARASITHGKPCQCVRRLHPKPLAHPLSSMLSSAAAKRLVVCARCRPLLTSARSLYATPVVERKLLSGPPQRFSDRPRSSKPQFSRKQPPPPARARQPLQPKKLKDATADRCRSALQYELRRWSRSPQTIARLGAMGVEEVHARRLLATFVDEEPLVVGGWFPESADDTWQMKRVMDDSTRDFLGALDAALTRRFMAWVIEATRTRRIVPPGVRDVLNTVYDAVDYTDLALVYKSARKLRRKIHMHVGPTNSGKTHNALRALAASKRGVYASPLRLLAYEVFERLNKGRIMPLDVDSTSDPETWARSCNLLTGEEARIVDSNAGLLSCTIEMLRHSAFYDVAVVDEIQMLSDPERGGAWTAAVLGLNANEIHLCGEEASVPLVRKMLEDTGDEVIVHQYDRLSPLIVAPKSLDGDFKKIQKGDCVVAFSRNRLFDLKTQIEKETGMRCAIIYGRLPPEVRAEQAELFNTPGNGYDVLVGSDAIGMGLNLCVYLVSSVLFLRL